MKKILTGVVGVLLVLVIAVLAGCSEGTRITGVPSINLGSQQTGIWVSGTGKATVSPDLATLQVGVQSQQTSVAQAQTEAATAMDKVMTSLKNNGLAAKDIQTQYFNVQKVTRWDDKQQKEVVLGYMVTNTVTAKIRAMDKVGTIIDAVSVAGGDLIRINGVSFSVEDPTNYQKDARAKAMADAQAKAKQMADLSGVKLGKPTYITESVYSPSPIYQGMVKAAAPAPMPAPETPISVGEMNIVVNVQITFDME